MKSFLSLTPRRFGPTLGLLALLAGPALAQESPLLFEAHLPADTDLSAGQEAAFVLTTRVHDDDDARTAVKPTWRPGMAATSTRLRWPILRLDVPEGIELVGSPPRRMRTPHDFETTFLGFPHGRKVYKEAMEIRFKVVEPSLNGAFELDLTYYTGLGEDAAFHRTRLRLPLRPGAKARKVSANDAHPSFRGSLAIGDRVSTFELPDLRFENVLLEDVLAEGPALLFTYRAHW